MSAGADWDNERGLALAVLAWVLTVFGAEVLINTRQRWRWPLPGKTLAALFLLALASLVWARALSRLSWVPWQLTGFWAFVHTVVVTGVALWIFGRWWRSGLRNGGAGDGERRDHS